MIKKLILGAIALVVLLVVGGVILAYVSINSAVKAGIETVGPKFTGTTVTVEAVRISPFTGSGTIRGLVIGNPEGYKTPHAFSLGEISISLDTGSVLSDEVIIHEVVITQPQIVYEQGLTGNNISDLKRMVIERTGGDGKDAEASAGPKVVIERFAMTGGEVHLGTTLSAKTLPVAVPPIELKNVGRSDGATVADTVSEVFVAVAGSVTNAVATSGQLLEAGKGAVKKIGEAGKKAVEGVKNLFNKDDE